MRIRGVQGDGANAIDMRRAPRCWKIVELRLKSFFQHCERVLLKVGGLGYLRFWVVWTSVPSERQFSTPSFATTSTVFDLNKYDKNIRQIIVKQDSTQLLRSGCLCDHGSQWQIHASQSRQAVGAVLLNQERSKHQQDK